MNNKSIKLSDYFKLIKPEYVYIQITPHKSIRNYNSSNIAKAIAHTYKALNKRIDIQKKKIAKKIPIPCKATLECEHKISYVIDIKNNNASFYFIVPKPYVNILLEKTKEIWSKATINLLDKPIEQLSKDCDFYQLSYKKEDALSLYTDKKSNEPLNSILSVMDIMKDDDRITLIYNFTPTSQFWWLDRYDEIMDRIKNKKSVEKATMNLGYILKNVATVAVNIIDGIMEIVNDFLGGKPITEKESLYSAVMGILEQQQILSSSTKKKKEQTILPVQIAVASQSNDDTRKRNNAITVCQSFRTLDEDNELKYKECKPFKLEDYSLNTKSSIMSTDECSNFVQIPGRTLLTQHNINFIKTEENQVVPELQQGYINLGENSFKGTKINTYLEDDYNVGSYPLSINGSQGSGKSTYIANIYKFARKRNEGGVLIDYIKNNELTEEVLKYIPKEDVIVLDYSDDKCMQGFAFNEVANLTQLSPFQKIKNANLQVMQFVELINAINDESQPLQARMRKYLIASGTVVLCTGETSLKAIIDCLEDCEIRDTYINRLDVELLPLLEDKIKILRELDDYSKPTKDNPVPEVIGNKDSKIDGILDRVSLLKEDVALEYMFNKGSKNNIDFAKELESGKLIIIKMLQDEWSSQAKDIITTFFISKIWMATEIRGKWNKQPKRTYISIDEIFQCPTAMNMLSKKNILPQTRKFGCKFVFTTQGLAQLKQLLNSIIDAGGTFMLLKGTKEEDFNLLKNKFENYEYEDLRDMAKTYDYPSLNLVYYSKGYCSFITKLPPPKLLKSANNGTLIFLHINICMNTIKASREVAWT